MLYDLGRLRQTKLEDENGNVINPATQETLQAIYEAVDELEFKVENLKIEAGQINLNTDELETKVQSVRDQLNCLLSTRASEATATEIRDTIGQASGVTVLSRLLDLWNKLVELFNTGVARVKLWDGTNQAGIDSANHIYVAGKSTPGSAPLGNPLSISGIDSGGLKRTLKTDSYGRLETISPTAAALANTPVQICMQKKLTAVNNYEWQEILEYEVPAGYDFNAISFCAISEVANEAAKAIYKLNLGSFNCATNTFTDGSASISPQFSAKMFIYVTSAIGSGSNDVITITYTNQDGVTGRTGTVTITKSSIVGTRLEVTLQTGDYGFIDVTNVTHSAIGQAGAFNIEGNLALFTLILTSANVQYHSPTPPLNAIVVPAGGKIYLQYLANSLVANTRGINLQGSLAPR